ncbi:S-adenosyl-L-methionine-dependent methyltransferase [Infundibulicybe gibba]|nr:S-adenosyl-L-methionine-dependent methyltransferase [Infundibulicybe gibba]
MSTVPKYAALVRDPRLALLPTNFFKDAVVLDVGCNEGWVTCEIAQLWGARKVTGVDIDDALVRAAWRRRLAVWSSQGPFDPQTAELLDRPPYTQAPASLPDYFPLSCEHEFGPLPIPPFQVRGKHSFPHNLSFRTADWTTTPIPEDATAYTVVIAFSISKWIHLNGGDKALDVFFRRVHAVLKVDGSFALEPQARSEKMQKHLKIRPDDFGSLLQGIGFSPPKRYGVPGDGGFRRPVDVYTRL